VALLVWRPLVWMSLTAIVCWWLQLLLLEPVLAVASLATWNHRYGSTPGQTTSTCEGACTAGFYCSAGSSSPTQSPCAPGKWGDVGATSASCSGICEPGYYCPTASSSPTPATSQCSATTFYCPIASGSPTEVGPGMYAITDAAPSVPGHSAEAFDAQEACPAGSYCVNGVRYDCPAGRYGTIHGMTDPACEAPCPAGRFAASAGQASAACEGGCMAGYWCPEGSLSPRERPCAAGRWSAPGEGVPCTQLCRAGWYCSLGSATATPSTGACTSTAFYCPQGSPTPLAVDPGFYATRDVDDGDTPPPEGQFSGQAACPRGWYCQLGVRSPCPAGRFGAAALLTSVDQCTMCEAGRCAFPLR